MGSEEPAAWGGDPSAFRVGDAERNASATALGEHMAAGRLNLDEFGTRSALANTARTAGELQALFADLPSPHPALLGSALLGTAQDQTARLSAPPHGTSIAAVADQRSKAQKLGAAAAGASTFVGLILFFITDRWQFFLIIPLISAVAHGLWGDRWKSPKNKR